MDEVRYFPPSVALSAMGNSSKRYQKLIAEGRLYMPEMGMGEPSRDLGRGRGRGRQYSFEGVQQGKLTFLGMDAGLLAGAASFVAFKAALQGNLTSKLRSDSSAPFDGVRDRHPGRPFEIGRTWIAIALNQANRGERESALIFSDANPDIVADKSDVLGSVCDRIGEPVDGEPRILICYSDVYREVCLALGLDPEAMMREGF